MKNRIKIITATLAVGAAATLAGCGGCIGCTSCSSCDGDTADNTITRSNWFTGTSYSGIQPSFIDTEGNDNFSPEKITYEVTYDKESANNNNYSLDYQNGTFTTEFYATKYDWSKSGIPEGYAPEKATVETVYYYKTELDIFVTFKMKTGDKKESEQFHDHVVTEAYFRAAGNNLQPVYSRQSVKSTSPKSYQPVTLEQAIEYVDVTYENYYNYNCTKVLSYATENPGKENEKKTEKEHGKLNKLDKTLFDNSSLYIAVRSMKLSSSLSQPVALFSPAAGGVDEYAVTGTDASLTADEKEKYTTVLAGKGLFKAESENTQVDTAAVNISFAGGDLHGTSQTVWYAAITDSDNNVPRATMLKLSVPLSYSLGTLNYSLKSIESTLWSDNN